MYRTLAVIPEEADDSKAFWDDTKAELRRNRLDRRLGVLAELLDVGEDTTKVPLRKVLWAKWEALFAPICRVVGALYIYSRVPWGWWLALLALSCSHTVLRAFGAVARTVLEVRRYGGPKNRLPFISLAMLFAAAFAWKTLFVWSDLHADAALFGEGSSSRLTVACALWAALAHLASRRREWSTDHPPGPHHEVNPTEAVTP